VLVNCVLYRDGRRLKDIGVDEIPQWRDQPGTFVWVALHDPTPDEIAQVGTCFDLHELAIEDVRKGGQRPKIEEYDDTLFVIMPLLEMHDQEINVGEAAIFVGPDFVLSIRMRCSQGFLGVRARAEREPELLRHGPGYVFYALVDAIVDRYLPVIEKIEEQLEDLESRIFVTGAARDNVRELYVLKQRVMIVRHVTTPVTEAIDKLHGGRVPPVVQELGEYFRDVFDHLSRIQTSVEGVREMIITAINVNLAMVTIDQSDVAKRLAAWAAIFAAMTTLAGIWGMNFEHMPELKWQYGYPLALGLMIVVALYLHRLFRRAGWL
jgi:magnesium transporter